MANTVIALKKSATPSATPVSLANGELAINYSDGKLFYKHANGTIAAISSGAAGDSFGTVNAAGTLIIADTAGDILTLEAGSGITITGDAINDKITISSTGGDISPALIQANTARDQANTAFLGANAALIQANTARNQGNTAFTQANTARDTANTAGTDAVNAFGKANTACTKSDTAQTTAVAAFATANAALPNTSGISFNGNLNFPTGNVGIGTTNPTLKLDVSGSSTQGIRVTSTDTSGSNIAYFTAQHGSGSSLQLRSGVGYTYLLSTSAVPLYMGTNSAIHMTVAASGNVGIGTTSPAYKLDVNGTVNAAAVLVNGAPITGGSGGAYYSGNNGDVGEASGLGDIFRVHTNTLSANVTIYSGNNALAAGPITVAANRTLTIQANARVAIV